MKVGVIGSGIVAKVLAAGFVKEGNEVMMGTRDVSKLKEWQTEHHGKIGSMKDAAEFGDVVVLAVKGNIAESLVSSLAGALKGKTVLDTTNPIADEPPVNGVLKFFTDINESLMERLQKAAPDAKFVKVFSCVGNSRMVHPAMTEGSPTMFICGNDEGAKKQTTDILKQFGWEWEDFGMAEAARAIEPLCMLWCIPGFLSKNWTHAFKMLKK